MIKKYILGLIIAISVPLTVTFASAPMLTVSPTGDGNNVVTTITNADGNSSVALFFNSSADGTTHSQIIGTTNTTGGFSGTVNTTSVGINQNTPVYAMVNGYSSNNVSWPYSNTSSQPQITFSQNNTVLAVGQNGTLTVSGGAGNYYISSNSNSAAIAATISGNTLSFSAVGNGSSMITICSISGGLCGLTTLSTNGNPNGGLQLNPSTLTLAPNQAGTVQVSGGSSPYTVSTVSGDSLSFSYIGNTLTITAATNGSRTLTVCASNSVCTTLVVTVSGTPNNNVTLSPSALTLNQNQAGTVIISGGNSPYTVSTVTGNSLSTSVVGNILTVQGGTVGVTSLTVCSQNNICGTLVVTIGGTSQVSAIGFSSQLAINQIAKLTLTGGSGSAYYLQSALSSLVSASVSGNTLSVMGMTYGTAVVTVCQSSNSTCLPLTFTVNQPAVPATGTGGPYIFNNDLWFGQTNNEVVELQKYLIGENYLFSNATSYFGALTQEAVRKFQTAKNVNDTGYVGPLTRTELNN